MSAAWRLQLWSWAAHLGYQAIVLAPPLLVATIGVLVFNVRWMWIASGVVLLLLWWLSQGMPESPDEVTLGRDEAPGLWRWLDQLSQAMQAPPVARVVLVGEATAAAAERQDAWWPWRHHRTLIIGWPLLSGLAADELQAVMAHELAHFSRHFGPQGHRLYRARSGWASLLQADGRDAVWFQAAAHFARWFVPRFERATAGVARANEFEADALAAHVISSEALGRALLRLAGQALEGAPVFGAGPLPADPVQWMGQPLARGHGAASRQQALALDDAWHAASDPAHATHPPVAQRLAALGLQAGALPLPPVAEADSAGALAWGAGWPARRALANQHWCEHLGRAWTLAQGWREACAAQLARPACSEADRLEAQLALQQPVDLTQLSALDDEPPPLTRFWTGVAWAGQDAAVAKAWLESAVRAAPVLAAPTRARLAALPTLGREELARQCRLLALARERRRQARARSLEAGPREMLPVDQQDWRREALVAALAAEPAVLQAVWLCHRQRLDAGREFEVVTLALQLELDGGLDEPQAQLVYGELLARVVTPMRVGLVQCHWHTVRWPAWLQAHALRHPADMLKAGDWFTESRSEQVG